MRQPMRCHSPGWSWLLTLLVLLVATAALPALAGGAERLPPGFVAEPVAAIPRPTALAALPNGDLYAASQGGVLYRIPGGAPIGGGSGRPPVALDLRDKVCDTSGERGLLGVAVDPRFAKTRFVFLYYTGNRGPGCGSEVNRVSRFVGRPNGKLDPGSERVLIDNIPSPSGNHNGGDLQFGGDGFLYVSVGDGGCDLDEPGNCQNANDNARQRNLLLGKILRITAAGGVPADNPHVGPGSARCHRAGGAPSAATWCREIWATGLRNPFRIAFDPSGRVLFINDVGGGRREEIDRGRKGADYGWNVCEGAVRAADPDRPCGMPRFARPVFDYAHGPELVAITGGAFVPEGAGWPATFAGGYLFGDLGGGIYLLSGGAADMSAPVFEAATPIHLLFHEGALYVGEFGGGGRVTRIRFAG